MRTGRSARVAGLVLAGALGLAGCGMGDAVVGIHDAPSETTSAASLDQASAQRIATRVLDDAAAALVATGPLAAAKQQAVLTGAALAVAHAATVTNSAPKPGPAPLTKPSVPKILAVSKGMTWPRAILAARLDQETNRQYLDVLVSDDPTAPFKLAASVPMHAGASIPALGDLADGAPLVTAGDGAGMLASPAEVLKQYAGALAQPKATAATDVATTDPFAQALSTSAKALIASLAKLGRLTEAHTVVPSDTISFRLANGGAVVFGLLRRVDTVTLAGSAKELKLPAAYVPILHRTKVAKMLTITSLESVVAVVGSTDMAIVVGADDQIESVTGH